jgi:hypothetical protein
VDSTMTMSGPGVGRMLGTAALGILVLAGPALAGPDSRKMDRQIDLFERIVDDMLVESPNWLVRSHHEARGRYRSGEGARFTFDATLIDQGWFGSRGGSWWKSFLRDDDDVIVIDRDDWDNLDDKDLADLRRDSKKSREEHKDRLLKHQERLYERGKSEMVEMLADFGDLLTTVPDGETVQLVAYLGDADYFYEHDIRTLTMTAKMSDVRAAANGSIDEKKFVQLVKVEES